MTATAASSRWQSQEDAPIGDTYTPDDKTHEGHSRTYMFFYILLWLIALVLTGLVIWALIRQCHLVSDVDRLNQLVGTSNAMLGQCTGTGGAPHASMCVPVTVGIAFICDDADKTIYRCSPASACPGHSPCWVLDDTLVGPSGPSGATGSTGSTGSTGAIGNTGATGAVGPSGGTGATGTSGTMGPSGSSGATGASGTMGPSGSSGATGASGATGPSGGIGASGSSGATGATGATGSTPSLGT